MSLVSLSRFIAPVALFALAGVVYSRLGTGTVIVLAGLERFVGRDPYQQGLWTVRLLVGVGVLWSAYAAFILINELRQSDQESTD